MKRIFFAIWILVSISTAVAGGNIEAGKEKAAICSACHGMDGNSMNPVWPSLAGQHAHYLLRQLIAFKKGEADGGRYNPNMTPLMADYSEEDFKDLAAYYASLEAKIGFVEEQHVERGQRIYRGGDIKTQVSACMACHGPRGLGNAEAGFPRLSGQKADYTVLQLQAYKKGERGAGLYGQIMQAIAKRMSEEDMQAVASYVEGLS